MGRSILKVRSEKGNDFYLIWSSVVDAPTYYGMSLKGLKKHYRDAHGYLNYKDILNSLERVNQKGVSCRMHSSVEDFVEHNRAGDKEECLSLGEIIEKYCDDSIYDKDSTSTMEWEIEVEKKELEALTTALEDLGAEITRLEKKDVICEVSVTGPDTLDEQLREVNYFWPVFPDLYSEKRPR